MTAPTNVVEQFVQRARGLYSLPAVAMRVLELTNSPQVDARALKQCIENDPALTTRILRVVNSSLFGLSREVSDLNQALALLGTKPLKMLVLGFSLPKNLFAALEEDVLARYWRHALTKAIVARELATRFWRMPGDDAFIAGLLQEIGQLVLVQDLGEPYVRFAQRVLANGGDLVALELETLGFDHAILSARLLEHWGLPESIVRGIAAPRDAAIVGRLPEAEQSLPQILHVSELIARLLITERPQSLEELFLACQQYGRPGAEDLPLLLDDLDDKVQQLAEVLNLKLGDGGDYRTILADAHAQLATIAGEAAIELLEPAVWGETAALSQAVKAFIEAPSRRSARQISPATVGTATESPATKRHVVSERATDWEDPGLIGRLRTSLSACRQQRVPLSLLLLEVDHFDEWILIRGKDATLALMERLAPRLAGELEEGCAALYLGDGQFALVLTNYDRQASLAAARALSEDLRGYEQDVAESCDLRLTLSMGVASLDVPPKNFPAQELVSAARRCVGAARLSGGNTVKSIELV